MIKLYTCLLVFYSIACLSAQGVVWQRDVTSHTQDFLSHLTTTIDHQFLVSGSSIHKRQDTKVKNDEIFSYDYRLIKFNQQGEKIWEKFYGGLSHDYLNIAITTSEGGFLLAGSSYSTEGGDKKDVAYGGSDIWLIKLSENGEEEWQKTIGTEKDEEAKAIIQTVDLGFIIAGNVQNHALGLGSKDVLVAILDSKGNLINQILLGGEGLDEVEKMIPTKDGGVLLAIYSRSGDSINLLQLQEKRSKIQSSNSNILNKFPSQLKNDYRLLYNNSNISIPPIQNIYAKNSDNYGEGDYWIVKLNRTGKIEWQRSFGGNEDDRIRDISLTSSGVVVSGESRSSNTGNKSKILEKGSDLWVLSLDEFGNEIWQQSYSFGHHDVLMNINTIWNKEGGARERIFIRWIYTIRRSKEGE